MLWTPKSQLLNESWPAVAVYGEGRMPGTSVTRGYVQFSVWRGGSSRSEGGKAATSFFCSRRSFLNCSRQRRLSTWFIVTPSVISKKMDRVSRQRRFKQGAPRTTKKATAGGEKGRGELCRGRKGVYRLSVGMGSKGSVLGGGRHWSSPTLAQNYIPLGRPREILAKNSWFYLFH